MEKINLSKQGFQFFLAGSTVVDSLESGAIKFGGATKVGDKIISNIPAGNFVEITNNNTVKIFIPSTIANKPVNSSMFQENVIENALSDFYYGCVSDGFGGMSDNFSLPEITETKGSWYSENLKKVIIEDIYIISWDVKNVTEKVLETLIYMANSIKEEMSQEGVSIMINNALAII